MFRKIVGMVILSLLLSCSLVAKLDAQGELTPQKQALIKELLEVTEAKKMAENFTDIFLVQMERNYPMMISQMMSEVGISEVKEQAQLQQEIIASQLRFTKRFRELYPQRVNLEEVVEQIYYPLYSKYFTEDEIRDLLVFYKSPTGKKTIRVMPQLMQESMEKSSQLLNPKIIELVNEILQEEKERLSSIQEPIQEENQQ